MPTVLATLLLAASPAFAQDETEPAGSDEESEPPPSGEAERTYGDEDETAPAEEAPPPEEEELYAPEEDEAAATNLPTTVCQGRRIRRIRVRGNRRVSDEDVLAVLHLRPSTSCTDTLVARDAHALWDQGFYDDIVFEADPVGDDRVDVVVRVSERPAIASIVYEGNSSVNATDLNEVVHLSEGGILSVPEVRQQITHIRDKYAEQGFFLARVSYRLRRQENNQVDVVYHVDEGQRVTVRSVRFSGNRHIPDSQLGGIIRTRQTGFFSFISNDDRFNHEHFDEDVTRLQAYYYDQGYLSMRVGTPRVALTPDRRFIDIAIPIDEGPRFRIGRLVVRETDQEGQEVEPLGGRREIRALVQANPGEWFNRTRIAQSLQSITRRYRDDGFAFVQINPETDLDMERRIVNIAVVIHRGPPVRIERINIRGNTKTRDSVIRREVQLIEGELYSQSLAEVSKNRIQALGYFERVELSEEEGSAPDRIIVNIEVAEKATGTFQIGAGFSSIESFILTGQVQQQNLFGNGQSLSLQLQLSGIRQLVQIQLVEPYFFNTQFTVGVNLFKTVRQLSFFTRDSTGASVNFGHPLGDYRLRFYAQYRADYVTIGNATAGLFGTTPGGLGFSQAYRYLYPQVPLRNLFRAGLTSSVQLTLTWDGRNNRLYPTEGFYASWSTEIADRVLGSANTFIRNNLDVRVYQPIFENVIFRARGVWGLVTSRLSTARQSGVPIYERYFLGGIYSVRGFNLNQLGPRIGTGTARDPNSVPSARGVPVGGNMQFFYNIEIEFPIVQEVGIRGVVFTDGGNAWNLSQQICSIPAAAGGGSAADPCQFNPFNIRTSWGFGLRWVSPLGPLRFEWGLPFMPNRALGEQPINFQFTIGNFF